MAAKAPLSAELVEVGAKDALEHLERNTSNRPKSRALINRYRDQMLHLAGRWRKRLPFRIDYDWKDEMHNGQHTLHALVAAEEMRQANPKMYAANGVKGPIKLSAVVVSGIDPDDVDFIEVGKSRNHGDITYRQQWFDREDFAIDMCKSDPETGEQLYKPLSDANKKQLSNILKTAAKFVWLRLWWAERPRSSRRFSHDSMLEVYDTYPALADSVFKVWHANFQSDEKSQLKRRGNLAYFAAVHFLAGHYELDTDGLTAGEKSWQDADDFIDHLANGCERGTPEATLRDWLGGRINDGKTQNDDLERMFLAMLHVFNGVYIEGNLTKIKAAELNKLPIDESVWLGGIDVKPELPEPEEEEEAEPEPEPPKKAAKPKKKATRKKAETKKSTKKKAATKKASPPPPPAEEEYEEEAEIPESDDYDDGNDYGPEDYDFEEEELI